MKPSTTAQELVDALWAEAKKHTPLHPEDKKKKDLVVRFFQELEALDSETFWKMIGALERPLQDNFRRSLVAVRQIT